MSKLGEIIKIENEMRKADSLYEYSCDIFRNLVIAADDDNKDDVEELLGELNNILSTLKTLSKANTNNGSYTYLTAGIKRLISAANVIKKAMGMSAVDLIHTKFDMWDIIHQREFYRKYDGPRVFESDLKSNPNAHSEINRRFDEILDVDQYVAEIINISFNQMTNYLPDYYDMCQITGKITIDDLVSTIDIAEIINNGYNISPENLDLINNYFQCFIGDKSYKVTISKFPFELVISCSDGRQIKVKMTIDKKEIPYFDTSGFYDSYTTNLSLYFPTNYDVEIESTACFEAEDKCETDAIEIIKNLHNPLLPNGQPIDWRYIALHKNQLISAEELSLINCYFDSFIRGITNDDPTERIVTLAKSLGTIEEAKLRDMLKGTD